MTSDVRTNHNNMVVELAFIFSFTIHLGHLFQAVKHALYDLFIGGVDTGPDLEIIGTDELALDLANINGEMFDEVGHPLALFAGQLGLLHPFDLLILWTVREALCQIET